MIEYSQQFKTGLPEEFAPDAPQWLLERATTELPNAVRVQAIRCLMFLGAYAMADSDERRDTAMAGIQASGEGYNLLVQALVDPDQALRDFPGCCPMLHRLAETNGPDLTCLRKHGTMFRTAMDSLATGAVDTGLYNDLIDHTYGHLAPSLTALHQALSEQVLHLRDAARKDAMLAKADANKACEEISKIAKTVQMISLNARVEAARAGDAGRAFSVIAGEIKELSEEAESTSQRVVTAVDSMMARLDA